MHFCQEYGHYWLSIINKNPSVPGIIVLLDVKIKRNSVILWRNNIAAFNTSQRWTKQTLSSRIWVPPSKTSSVCAVVSRKWSRVAPIRSHFCWFHTWTILKGSCSRQQISQLDKKAHNDRRGCILLAVMWAEEYNWDSEHICQIPFFSSVFGFVHDLK